MKESIITLARALLRLVQGLSYKILQEHRNNLKLVQDFPAVFIIRVKVVLENV